MEKVKVTLKRLRRQILLAAIPISLTALYYLFRHNTAAMDAIGMYLTSRIRAALSLIFSVYPFSVAEILITLAAALAVFSLVQTIVVLIRRGDKLRRLGKRAFIAALTLLYAWAAICWLWNSAYFESSFAEKNDLTASGVSVDDLYNTASYFAGRANSLAPLVPRDDGGHMTASWNELRDLSSGIYTNLEREFPVLKARAVKPKPMLYSKFQSLMGYTGFYFALTGEANVNTDTPVSTIPVTIAHELAHLRGVSHEDEANFVGIAACVTSDSLIYQYSGYLSGLSYLMRALLDADFTLYTEIHSSLRPEILFDWDETNKYWLRQQNPDTGIKMLDEAVTVMSETVDTVYDGYLKSNGQELGMRSYGACVDLLVLWITGKPQ